MWSSEWLCRIHIIEYEIKKGTKERKWRKYTFTLNEKKKKN